jgi:hypothetical protein
LSFQWVVTHCHKKTKTIGAGAKKCVREQALISDIHYFKGHIKNFRSDTDIYYDDFILNTESRNYSIKQKEVESSSSLSTLVLFSQTQKASEERREKIDPLKLLSPWMPERGCMAAESHRESS